MQDYTEALAQGDTAVAAYWREWIARVQDTTGTAARDRITETVEHGTPVDSRPPRTAEEWFAILNGEATR